MIHQLLLAVLCWSAAENVQAQSGDSLRTSYPEFGLKVTCSEAQKKYLQKYVEPELKSSDCELIKIIQQQDGDFGLPGELTNNPSLVDFLRYAGDHYREAYLHIGMTPEAKNVRVIKYKGDALRDLWLYYGDDNARKKYLIILKHALRNIDALEDGELIARINEQGTGNLWHPIMKAAALYYARSYRVSGDEREARRAIMILKRFGEVLDKWLIYFKDEKNKPGAMTADRPLPAAMSYGLWGWWGDTFDLISALPLLEAYVLVKDSKTYKALNPAEQKIIYHDLLCRMVEKNLLFRFRPLHNQNMARIKGMAYWGKILNRPEYVHIALTWIKTMLHVGFRRDGMWSEEAISYGIGVARGLIEVSDYLAGYSDPPGYTDARDLTRIDKFNPQEKYGNDFNRIKNVFNRLALPDGHSLAIEDSTWTGKGDFFTSPPTEAVPFLLGASGLGMLGFGKDKKQVRLYLHWDGVHNHDHYDALGITLWAHGEEICSETAYRGWHDWNISTAAHNTVVVDEKNQDGRGHLAVSPKEKMPLWPYVYGELWGAYGLYDCDGRLNLWDTTDSQIQVAEVDANANYDQNCQTQRYRRTLALIRVGMEDFYWIDIFRINGGKVHDYMLHGNLARPYKISLSAGAKAPISVIPEISCGTYLKAFKALKNIQDNTTIEFVSEGNAVMRTIMVGNGSQDFFIAKGPAIRFGGEPSMWNTPGKVAPTETRSAATSEFLMVRHPGPNTIFIAVHEVYDKNKEPLIKAVDLLKLATADNSMIGIKIKLKDREDIFISGTDSKSMANIPELELTFTGKVFCGMRQNGIVSRAYALDAQSFVWGPLQLTGPHTYNGRVLSISSVSRGASKNAFTVAGISDPHNSLAGRTIIVRDGAGRTYPYTIIQSDKMSENRTQIIVDSETGLSMDDGGLQLLYYPGWHIPGTITYTIPGNSVIINKKR